jgi:hypothetical protein
MGYDSALHTVLHFIKVETIHLIVQAAFEINDKIKMLAICPLATLA